VFDAESCNVASGCEKGQIEKNVQDSRRLSQKVPTFGSLGALNNSLADQCVLLWQQPWHPGRTKRSGMRVLPSGYT
jgi:hypothetical protein